MRPTILQATPLALVRTLPPVDLPIPEDPLSPTWRKVIMEYIEQLSASVKLRVQDIPRLSGYDLPFRFLTCAYPVHYAGDLQIRQG